MSKPIRRTLGVLATATGAGLVLLASGDGALAAPRQWSLDGVTDLVDERGPVSAALTLVRCTALAACAYLVALGMLTVAARVVRVRWLHLLLRCVTPRVLRPVLGIVTVATLATPRPVGAADTTSSAPVMVLVESSSTRPPPTTSPPPTMRRVAAPTPPTTTSTTTTGPAAMVSPVVGKPATSSPTAATARDTPTATPRSAPATWTIARGEHLWYVAEATLTRALGHPPSARETTTYWRALIDANRDRLVDRENPDLVFAGQELLLPPTPMR